MTTTSVAFRAPQWGAVLAILAMALIVFAVPDRYTLGPAWLGKSAALALSAVGGLFIVSTLLRTRWGWKNFLLTVAVGIVTVLNVLVLGKLVMLVLYHGEMIDGVKLLKSAVAVWAVNVVEFALIYWLVDGGGPDERVERPDGPRDFAFPVEDPKRKAQPGFVEYLFLAFTTATAFSPADTPPLTTRARVLIMVQSLISLVTLVIAAARAVGILR